MTQSSSEMAEQDLVLVRECRNDGRSEAFDRLVERYEDRIFGLILRLTGDRERALELTQETFVKAFRGLKAFKGDSAFFTWLYRIGLNVARSDLRKGRRRHVPLSLPAAPKSDAETRDVAIMDDRAGPVRLVESEESCARIAGAIASLVPEFREIVVLRDVDDRSYEEIAGILEVPVGTVRSRLHRARMELRALLADLLD